MGVAVLVGTRKGLFVLTSDETRRDCKVEGPQLTMSFTRCEIRSLRPLVNVYVDRNQTDDLETPLEAATEVRLVAAVAGGLT